MGKGMVKVPNHKVAEWFAAGKTKNDMESLLNLPNSYQIEGMSSSCPSDPSVANGYLCVTVSSDEIPETKKGNDLPLILIKALREEPCLL